MTAAICPEVRKNAYRKFGSSPKRLGHSFKARMLNKDYREMLQCLLEEKVRFLLVGAYALAVHGFCGVEFERAYANRKSVIVEGLEIPVISVPDLIANKRATGRTQDLADVEKLESASNRG
jgi:hypothetical protein